MAKNIGIDLGTTNCSVVVMEGSTPKVTENSEGGSTTPSIIASIKDGELLVGQSTKRQAITTSKNPVFAIKRLLGLRFDDSVLQSVVQKDIGMVPSIIVKADNGGVWIQAYGKKATSPEISAKVLQKMKHTVEYEHVFKD